MNREIEEMAKDLAYSIVWDDEDIMTVDGYKTALALRGKGYRKSTDVAREILALVWDAYQTTHYDAEFEERLDNIEKKYELFRGKRGSIR